MSSGSSSCSWHLKTMINFYLVLFYTTLIMLSRQVQPGRPFCLERGWGWGGGDLGLGAVHKMQSFHGVLFSGSRVLSVLTFHQDSSDI